MRENPPEHVAHLLELIEGTIGYLPAVVADAKSSRMETRDIDHDTTATLQ